MTASNLGTLPFVFRHPVCAGADGPLLAAHHRRAQRPGGDARLAPLVALKVWRTAAARSTGPLGLASWFTSVRDALQQYLTGCRSLAAVRFRQRPSSRRPRRMERAFFGAAFGDHVGVRAPSWRRAWAACARPPPAWRRAATPWAGVRFERRAPAARASAAPLTARRSEFECGRGARGSTERRLDQRRPPRCRRCPSTTRRRDARAGSPCAPGSQKASSAC